MQAMVLRSIGRPLVAERRMRPEPGPGQVRVRVLACAVCRTDLHVVDGELPEVRPPLVPGHEIVGVVDAVGTGSTLAHGMRVGIPWLGWTCGACDYCRSGRENLCDRARFTGYQIDGGYAEYTVADARYCLPLPEALDAERAAPLLCAGLIGYRALRAAGPARRIGLYGFGAAAHLIAQIALHDGRELAAFTRPDDAAAQGFARTLGVQWAGPSDAPAPWPLDAAIIFAPVGALVPVALRGVRKGGRVVCAGIHMSPIPQFPYAWLWGEREIVSVANLTRADGLEFMALAARLPLHVQVQPYALDEAQRALDDLRSGALQGAAVLRPPAVLRP
ncbi:MAG: zinc-dependent alcohol dehydrogenase family protein [Gammaproteobacteria bacterium]|nr:zinc-dependent alcohol dehydrogenase family protein [Gammaproteobacteria bacterium]